MSDTTDPATATTPASGGAHPTPVPTTADQPATASGAKEPARKTVGAATQTTADAPVAKTTTSRKRSIAPPTAPEAATSTRAAAARATARKTSAAPQPVTKKATAKKARAERESGAPAAAQTTGAEAHGPSTSTPTSDPTLRHRPRPVVDPAALRPAQPAADTAPSASFLPSPAAAPLTDDESRDLAELLDAIIEILRALARAAGVDPDTTERAIAALLAFVRRRITGEYHLDELGFDADFTDNVYLPLLRPLYRRWFRVEVRGIENVPSEGGALVVANHSGTIALDALMVQVALADEHPARRRLRMLGADLVFATPFVGEVARRAGATLASNADAERLLAAGEVVGVWPEGFKGVGKPFSERYRLQRFGRGGFVAQALRQQVPIVPCSIVGAEETYPMIGELPALAKLLGLPYFPITPTYPWLGVLGMVPLPTKWTIEFGEPIATDAMDPALADDPMTVLDLTDQVRETIQQSLYRLLVTRRSVFRG